MQNRIPQKPYIWMPSIRIRGYRPFNDTLFRFNGLDVIAGANGSGKSSLFEFLRFLRDACDHEIPPEIISGSVGQQIFHKPGPDRIEWDMDVRLLQEAPLSYTAALMGPVGTVKIIHERIASPDMPGDGEFTYLDFSGGKGRVRDPEEKGFQRKEWDLKRPNRLALGTITDPTMMTLFNLREYIRGWRFYNALHIRTDRIRKSAPISQDPLLDEGCGNLSAVLFYLMTEHQEHFNELQSVIRSAIPGFKGLNVKARGGPGEVIAFWQEASLDRELSLADLSDGTLRFIAWATLSIMPSPPTLICIDEPDQGVHPRTLPILAGLFEKAAERTQVILATHASYFLTQFSPDQVAVMKKVSGKSRYIKISDSRTLLDNLADFGTEELERMHQSDELEALA